LSDNSLAANIASLILRCSQKLAYLPDRFRIGLIMPTIIDRSELYGHPVRAIQFTSARRPEVVSVC
jgi:hypothetical protein